MDIKQLKEEIKDLPDDFEVLFEYEGPDTYTHIAVQQVAVSVVGRFVVMCNDED